MFVVYTSPSIIYLFIDYYQLKPSMTSELWKTCVNNIIIHILTTNTDFRYGYKSDTRKYFSLENLITSYAIEMANVYENNIDDISILFEDEQNEKEREIAIGIMNEFSGAIPIIDSMDEDDQDKICEEIMEQMFVK